MRENLTYGSRWQGMETGTWHGQLRHSQRKRGVSRLPSLHPRRHPLTLPADRAARRNPGQEKVATRLPCGDSPRSLVACATAWTPSVWTARVDYLEVARRVAQARNHVSDAGQKGMREGTGEHNALLRNIYDRYWPMISWLNWSKSSSSSARLWCTMAESISR